MLSEKVARAIHRRTAQRASLVPHYRARRSGNRPIPLNEIHFQENPQGGLIGWVLVPLVFAVVICAAHLRMIRVRRVWVTNKPPREGTRGGASAMVEGSLL